MNLARPVLVFAVIASAATAACSILYQPHEQCDVTADCLARGAAFSGSQCVANACVFPAMDAGGKEDVPPAPDMDASRFACGNMPAPEPSFTETAQVSIAYLDYTGGGAATAIDVRLCSVTDPDCKNPRSTVNVTPDGGGPGPGSGIDAGAAGGTGWISPGSDGIVGARVETGFDGFFEVRSPDYAPTYRYTPTPLRKDFPPFVELLVRTAELEGLAVGIFGRNDAYDPKTRGVVFTHARDCDGTPLKGARFEFSNVEGDTKYFQFYIINTTANIEAKETDGTGRGGFANVLPGTRTFTAFYPDGKRIGVARAQIRPGSDTVVTILPQAQ